MEEIHSSGGRAWSIAKVGMKKLGYTVSGRPISVKLSKKETDMAAKKKKVKLNKTSEESFENLQFKKR
ncbi:MAG: hypothetical protein IPP06_15850 [Saprospiraceae bacterium]|nr:hypothetical protein [Candidatus Vicinibacter affinis]